jgi:hypothetical protein
LTTLLLYVGEIEQHSRQFSQAAGDRLYLQQVVENALQQTESVCAMMKQIAGTQEAPVGGPGHAGGWETRPAKDARASGVMFSSGPGQKPLIKREREVLSLISEGVLQQTGRHANAHQPKDLRKPSRRGDAQALVGETRRTSSARGRCIRVRCSTARRALNCRGQPCDSVEIFHEGANTGRGPQRVDRDLGRAGHDGDGPERRNARFAFHNRSDVTRDGESARLRGYGSAVELGDTKTADFLRIGRLKRKHEAFLCPRDYRRSILAEYENSKP